MPHSQKAADQAVDWSLEKGEMTMPRIIPIRDLKDTTAISQMCKESREPVFITKNGYGDMVIMSMEAYEERMLLLDAEQKLAAAEEEIRQGRAVEASLSFRRLREKHGLSC